MISKGISMKRELNKWQLMLRTDDMLEYGFTMGWKRVSFGVFKLIVLPQVVLSQEGARITKENYRGFLISFIYWLPIRKSW